MLRRTRRMRAIDTPLGLKLRGCSGDAPPNGSHSRLMGLPGPTRTDSWSGEPVRMRAVRAEDTTPDASPPGLKPCGLRRAQANFCQGDKRRLARPCFGYV